MYILNALLYISGIVPKSEPCCVCSLGTVSGSIQENVELFKPIVSRECFQFPSPRISWECL